MLKNKAALLIVFSLLLGAAALVFLPGKSGPYLFDDYTNLLDNSYVKAQSLDLEEIKRASFSLKAGPLQRPISMASFTINHYFAGSFATTAPYKLVNIFIHFLNGLLIFWLTRLVLHRYSVISKKQKLFPQQTGAQILIAFSVALLWLIHPIQMTSVLYIVQRMTELSALFSLLAFICYFKARQQALENKKYRAAAMAACVTGFGILAMYSKENAILLPLFLLAFEYVLFFNESPWRHWNSLSSKLRITILIVVGLLISMALYVALSMAMPGYEARDFTLTERLLTESRVVVFYLSLILLPRLTEFALLHDDIAISSSIFNPWTTLPAILLIVALLLIGIRWRKKHALASLGILWFLVGHTLESTIFPLEIAHEHRNYLPTFGIVLCLVYGVAAIVYQTKRRAWWGLIGVAALSFGAITIVRANQWANPAEFYRREAMHHPHSAGAQMQFGMVLFEQRQYQAAMATFRNAVKLDPNEPGLLINMLQLAARAGEPIEASERDEALKQLLARPLTASSGWALKNAAECILDKCRALAGAMETWMRALTERKPLVADDPSLYYYFLARALLAQGNHNAAIDAYRKAYELDGNYLHPLIELAALYVNLGKPSYAEILLTEIRRVNARVLYPKNQEIAALEAMISDAKQPKQRK